MTVLEFKNQFFNELHETYSTSEIHSFFKLLLKHRFHFSSADIALKSTSKIEQHDLDFLVSASAELKKEKPIQYILGETEFYGLTMKVTKDTLIPRPETEELVAWILTEIKEQRTKSENIGLNILDIGTGSGCIAVALAKHVRNANVYAIDISAEALKIAKQNAQLSEVNVNFIEGNILEPLAVSAALDPSTVFDIIVSNPPYVRTQEKANMHMNVLKYEPHDALFVPTDNALIFYDKIADFANEKLSKNGCLFFEINQYLGVETQALLQKKKYVNVALKKDLFDNYRMIKAIVQPQIN